MALGGNCIVKSVVVVAIVMYIRIKQPDVVSASDAHTHNTQQVLRWWSEEIRAFLLNLKRVAARRGVAPKSIRRSVYNKIIAIIIVIIMRIYAPPPGAVDVTHRRALSCNTTFVANK